VVIYWPLLETSPENEFSQFKGHTGAGWEPVREKGYAAPDPARDIAAAGAPLAAGTPFKEG